MLVTKANLIQCLPVWIEKLQIIALGTIPHSNRWIRLLLWGLDYKPFFKKKYFPYGWKIWVSTVQDIFNFICFNQHYSRLTTFVPYNTLITSDQFGGHLSKWIFILEYKFKQVPVNKYSFIFQQVHSSNLEKQQQCQDQKYGICCYVHQVFWESIHTVQIELQILNLQLADTNMSNASETDNGKSKYKGQWTKGKTPSWILSKNQVASSLTSKWILQGK